MKLILLALLVFGRTALAVCGGKFGKDLELPRDCVSGGFVGVGLGYAAGPMKITQISSGTAPFSIPGAIIPAGNIIHQPFAKSMAQRASLSGFVANFNTGYDCRLGDSCWSIGFIGGGSLTVVHGRAPFTTVQTTINNAGSAVTGINGAMTLTKFVDEGNFDAGFRTGYLFNKRVFCFTHLGWSIHRIVFTTPQSIRSWPNWYNCLLVGVGIDIRITPHTVIGIALDAHIGSRSRISFYQNVSGANIGFYMRPLLAQGMTVFKYRLPAAASAYE